MRSRLRWHITLTYPESYPEREEALSQLALFLCVLKEEWELHPTFAVLERQQRGAPHFHLAVEIPPEYSSQVYQFREWLSLAWYQLVDSGDPKHLRAGTTCRGCAPVHWPVLVQDMKKRTQQGELLLGEL